MKCQLNSESECKSDLVNMVVTRKCDIFNDDSAEVIEVEEKPKDE